MKYTKTLRAKVAAAKRGDTLTFDGIPQHFVYGDRLILHYKIAEWNAWIPSTAVTGLRRRGVRVGY